MSVGQSRSTSGRFFHADWYHTHPQTTGEGHHATSNGRRRRKSVLTMYSPSLLLCPQLKPTKKWQVQLTQPASNNGNFPLDIDMAVFLLGLGAQGEDAASVDGGRRPFTHSPPSPDEDLLRPRHLAVGTVSLHRSANRLRCDGPGGWCAAHSPLGHSIQGRAEKGVRVVPAALKDSSREWKLGRGWNLPFRDDTVDPHPVGWQLRNNRERDGTTRRG